MKSKLHYNISNCEIKVTGVPLNKGHQGHMGLIFSGASDYPNSSSPLTLPIVIRRVVIKEAEAYTVWYNKAAWRVA